MKRKYANAIFNSDIYEFFQITNKVVFTPSACINLKEFYCQVIDIIECVYIKYVLPDICYKSKFSCSSDYIILIDISFFSCYVSQNTQRICRNHKVCIRFILLITFFCGAP